MTIPALPSSGSTNWYGHYAALDQAARVGHIVVAGTGIDPTGVADSTTAIQAKLTEAAAVASTSGQGATIYFPPGTFKVTGLTLGASGITVRGAGFTATAIVSTSTTAHLFSATNLRNFTFSDMKLIGAGTGSVDGINLSATGSTAIFDCTFRNLYISDFGRNGIRTVDLCASSFDHVRVEGCDQDGFHFTDNGSSGLGGTSVTLSSCFANACGRYGYYIDGLLYSTFNGCATDSCTTGYFVNRSSALTFNSCGVEATASPGYGFALYNGTTAVVLNACYALNINAAGAGFRVGANGGLNSSRIILNACRVAGSTAPTYSLQVDANNAATTTNFYAHPSAANAGTGTVTVLA